MHLFVSKRLVWLIPESTIIAFATCMFLTITMTAGILTVYFTSTKQLGM